MDLSSLLPKDQTEVQILHPVTGEGLGITITIAGPAHPAKVAFERTALDNRYKSKKAMDAASLMAESEGELVARTLAWTNVELNSEVLDCTPENVASVYGNPGFFWLRNQVARVTGDIQGFFLN